jgi:hypothetical protein
MSSIKGVFVRVSLRRAPVVIAALFATTTLAQAPPQPPPSTAASDPGSATTSTGEFFYGGYLGASFGDVEYLEIAPLVGYRFTPEFGMGLGLLYRYRKDTRSGEELSSTDYGANVFARYHVTSGPFLQGEYDVTSYEVSAGASTGAADRTTYDALLAGVGFNTAVGRGAGVYVLALYDFSYDESDPYRLYDSPVQLRVGVSIGF